MALVGEAGAERDLGQAEPGVCSQEVLHMFDPACDYMLVRRKPGGCLELPREMKGAEMDEGRLWHAGIGARKIAKSTGFL
jgi:hypothetical protein